MSCQIHQQLIYPRPPPCPAKEIVEVNLIGRHSIFYLNTMIPFNALDFGGIREDLKQFYLLKLQRADWASSELKVLVRNQDVHRFLP